MNFATEEREAYEEHLKWLRMEASALRKHEGRWFTEGEKNGEIKMLVFLLEHKFKTIPDHYRQIIQQANTELLQAWAKRVLNSPTIDEVFKVLEMEI